MLHIIGWQAYYCNCNINRIPICTGHHACRSLRVTAATAFLRSCGASGLRISPVSNKTKNGLPGTNQGVLRWRVHLKILGGPSLEGAPYLTRKLTSAEIEWHHDE